MTPVSAETASSVSEDAPVLAPYAPLASRRDEAMNADGSLRTEWHDVFESVGRHGNEVLSTWRNETARISRERGLAYRPDRIDATDRNGSWTLDPIPWVFSRASWQTIEEGIGQRIRLYAAILEDLYGGPQRILSEKLLPAEILFSHPGYLRCLHDIPPGARHIGLGIVATDLGYDSSGRLFALNDRFDRPFGLGLSLENRTVVNTVLPNLFRRCRVRRIGRFFVDWFDHLASCAPPDSETRRVAIVDATPEEKDSEISFLANYCGILRVIPSDLTVRDGRVWLKTIGGLEPIDVLWKYAAGRSLDPLETSQGYGRGVTGIFEALRQGNVTIASHPGCEALQSPGLFPYLAKICRTLLEEELQIPPVATWWCGDKGPRNHVLENLSTMVVKPVGLHSEASTCYGSRLTEEERSHLRARIEAEPERFVGQEELMLSSVPVSTDEGLVPRGAVLRTFSFPGKEGAPEVMPGGLARVSTREGVVVSTRQTGMSKDVWVRDHQVDSKISIAKAVRRSRLTSPETVTSHAAENLYWAGRNAERLDFISRFLTRILHGRTLGFAHSDEIESEHEALLVEALFTMSECESWLSDSIPPDEKLRLLLVDEKCPVSIVRNLANFYRTTNAIREQWSPSSVLAIESIRKTWSEGTRGLTGYFAFHSPLENLQLSLAAFLGMNLDSMTRDHGWVMLDAGRRIERAANIVNLLTFLVRREVEGPLETLLNESALFISDSLGTYQSLYRTEPRLGPMMRLLLGENDYPRSLQFLFHRLEQVLAKLPKPSRRRHPGDLIAQANEHIQVFSEKLERDLEKLEAIRHYAEGDLTLLGKELRALSDHLTKSYFSHADESIV